MKETTHSGRVLGTLSSFRGEGHLEPHERIPDAVAEELRVWVGWSFTSAPNEWLNTGQHGYFEQ